MKFMENFTAMDKKTLTIFVSFLLGAFVLGGCVGFALHGDNHGRNLRDMPQMMNNQRGQMMNNQRGPMMNNQNNHINPNMNNSGNMNNNQRMQPQMMSGKQDMTGNTIINQ